MEKPYLCKKRLEAGTHSVQALHYTSTSKDFITYAKSYNQCTKFSKSDHKCSYHPQVLFKEDVDPCLRSCSTNKLADELKKLIKICYQNLLHA